jgi:hypothetical protein
LFVTGEFHHSQLRTVDARGTRLPEQPLPDATVAAKASDDLVISSRLIQPDTQGPFTSTYEIAVGPLPATGTSARLR